MQEGLAALIQARKKWDPARGAFAQYACYVITRDMRKCIARAHGISDKALKKGMPVMESMDADSSAGRSHHDKLGNAATQEDQASTRERSSLLQEAIASLTEHQRTIVQMRVEEGLTLKEVAAKMGLSFQRIDQTFKESCHLLQERLRKDLAT